MLAELTCALLEQGVSFTWKVCGDLLNLGPATIRNVLACEASTEWLAFVDDDDLVDPNHLKTLLKHRHFADVVYSLGRVEGRDWAIPHDCDLRNLEAANTVPVTALVRRDAFLQAGGFPTDARNEDWGLWRTMKRQGARFVCVHQETWTYRFHDVGRGNRTFWNG
jgi:glycosyltransferase involved in cell wall biosynthesis